MKWKSKGYALDPEQKAQMQAEAAAKLLSEAHVITIPGSSYGEYGEGYIRFSLTMRADDVEARIAEAVDRISRLDLSSGQGRERCAT